MQYLKIGVVFLCSLSLSVLSFAQGNFKVETNRKTMDLSEYVEVKYIVEGGKARNFNPGDLSAFEISGKNDMSQTNIVNGRVTQSKIYTYYLKPKKEGTFKIAGGSVMIGKTRYRAKPVSITVSKTKQTEQADSLARKKQGSFDDFVYIDIVLDKDTVYKGEQVIARYNLYTLYQISNFNITENPALPGFWIRNLNDNNYPQRTQVINGKQFRVVELKRVAMFPQKSGNLELDKIEIEGYVKVKQSNRKRSNDPFQDLFDDPFFSSPFSRYKTEKRKIASETKTLVVKELPEPIPDGFTGGVGKFTAGASVANSSLKTNESLSLNFTINGDGNIKLLDGPELELPEGFEAYDTKIEENIYTNSGKVRGSKKFEYPIIPRKPGKYKIPQIDWWYFDVATEKYKNYKLGPYTITVEPGDDYADNQSTFDEGAYQLKPIKTGKAVFSKRSIRALVSSPVAWVLAGFPVLLLPLIGFIKKQQELNKPTEQQLQYSKAKQVAIDRLSQAEQFMHKQEDKLFYDEVIRSVWGYLQNKFGIENSELDKPIIQKTLADNNIQQPTTAGINEVISLCEIALFAPSASGVSKSQVYEKAVNHISEIEEQLS